MAKARAKSKVRDTARTYEIDGSYLREQIREAIKTYLAPATGIYEAVTGSTRTYVTRDPSGRFKGVKGARDKSA